MSELASNVRSIPQMRPGAFFESMKSETAAAIQRVIESGWYILGEEVQSFEREFCSHFHFEHAAGVANGTDAIAIALRSLGVGNGDRVATVSHTATATVAAIEMAGARPVFVEIDPKSYTISPVSLARTLQAFDSIKAVIAVHLYGHPADIPAIAEIARPLGVHVIEDCAQAHGAMLHGRFVGSMSEVSAFSFYPTKNLGALGDGGMVVTSDPALAKRVRMLREYGWDRRYVSEFAGVNSRLDELQAAILRIRLPRLDAGNCRRAEIAAQYNRGLADTGLTLPGTMAGATHVYHQYVVRHPERNRLREQLQRKGVGTNIHYPVPVHRQPAYASGCEMDPGGLEVTETYANEILSLPMYPELSEDEVDAVIDAVRETL
jgi:dTDP-4-amino-4,6-dideoxygalactose transaminase